MKGQTFRTFLSVILAAACLTALAGCDQATQTAGEKDTAGQAAAEKGAEKVTVVVKTGGSGGSKSSGGSHSGSDNDNAAGDGDFSREYRGSVYYDRLMEVQLTGDYRTDILAVAQSQLGYHEGDNLRQLDGTSQGSGDYSEYGYYFGSAGSGWCSMAGPLVEVHGENSSAYYRPKDGTCVYRAYFGLGGEGTEPEV